MDEPPRPASAGRGRPLPAEASEDERASLAVRVTGTFKKIAARFWSDADKEDPA